MDNCAICFQVLVDPVVICPACSSSFHQDHLAAWINLRHHSCPHCRLDLPSEIIDYLLAKSMEDLNNMRALEYLFGDVYDQSPKYLRRQISINEDRIKSIQTMDIVMIFIVLVANWGGIGMIIALFDPFRGISFLLLVLLPMFDYVMIKLWTTGNKEKKNLQFDNREMRNILNNNSV